MAWGKKKKEVPEEPEEPVRVYQKPRLPEIQPAPEVQKQVVGKGRIVAIEMLEGGFKTIIISNKLLGEIGEEFPID